MIARVVIAAVVMLGLLVLPVVFASTPCTVACVQPTPMPVPPAVAP